MDLLFSFSILLALLAAYALGHIRAIHDLATGNEYMLGKLETAKAKQRQKAARREKLAKYGPLLAFLLLFVHGMQGQTTFIGDGNGNAIVQDESGVWITVPAHVAPAIEQDKTITIATNMQAQQPLGPGSHLDGDVYPHTEGTWADPETGVVSLCGGTGTTCTLTDNAKPTEYSVDLTSHISELLTILLPAHADCYFRSENRITCTPVAEQPASSNDWVEKWQSEENPTTELNPE